MIKNFKGNIHLLTSDDRSKGGKVKSEKKSLANGLKNLKHGNYSDKYRLLLRCIDCPLIGKCDHVNKGYCVYLLEELSENKKFRKEVMQNLTIAKDTNDLLDLVRKKYEMNKKYVEFLLSHTFESSDSNG